MGYEDRMHRQGLLLVVPHIIPKENAATGNLFLQTIHHLSEVPLENIPVRSGRDGIVPSVNVRLVIRQGIVTDGTVEKDLHIRMVTTQGGEAIKDYIVRDNPLRNFRRRSPDILRGIFPVVILKILMD